MVSLGSPLSAPTRPDCWQRVEPRNETKRCRHGIVHGISPRAMLHASVHFTSHKRRPGRVDPRWVNAPHGCVSLNKHRRHALIPLHSQSCMLPASGRMQLEQARARSRKHAWASCTLVRVAIDVHVTVSRAGAVRDRSAASRYRGSSNVRAYTCLESESRLQI